MNPNPKFDLGDHVYYKNEEHIVTRCLWVHYGLWVYEIIDQIHGYLARADENDLLSMSEWNARNQHNQNNIGWAAMKSMASDNMKLFNGNSKTSCVCGAHKIKDSRHSEWCDIKE